MKFAFRIIVILLTLLIVGLPGCSAGDPLDYIAVEQIEADEIDLGGAQLLIPAYGEIYNTSFVNVDCLVADDFYLVSGNTTAGEMLGFADNGKGRLTYTDITQGRTTLVTTAMTVSLAPEDRPAVISAMIYKNGSPDTASRVGEYIGVDDPADALPIMCLMELLNSGDYLEIYISSSTDNITIIVNTMTLVATTVD